MADIFVTSDTHFHHENIIKYCNRPFKNAYEMDEVLVENWNKVIKPLDKVYHLGDVFMHSNHRKDFLKRLNGKKRLIVGNHDDIKNPELHRYFQKIYLWRVFKEFNMVLTHVPLHRDSFRKVDYNVHGHTHNNGSPSEEYRCVCVELTNYTPVHIEEVVRRRYGLDKLPEKEV